MLILWCQQRTASVIIVLIFFFAIDLTKIDAFNGIVTLTKRRILFQSTSFYHSKRLRRHPQENNNLFVLYATKSSKKSSSGNSNKKKSSSGGSSSTIKGFGGPSANNNKLLNVEIDRSLSARSFYEFLDATNGAGDNLKRTTLGYFSLDNDDNNTKEKETSDAIRLRGVVAIQDIPKGNDVINIPYELAVNLGPEGDDPTIPAIQFLYDYCTVMNSNDMPKRQTYYKMLPDVNSPDCYGSTDFFPYNILEELQSPVIVQETMERKKRVMNRYNNEIATNTSFPLWNSTTKDAVSLQHLQWAVWVITSRVLTVQGPVDSMKSYRLLIPYLDMCNHDRRSTHILTGRAVANGGTLRVVAGTSIKMGTQINIAYGGGVAGNDRFLQDYGFLDNCPEAYDSIAQELLGKRFRVGGGEQRPSLSLSDCQKTLTALEQTTIAQDQELLESLQNIDDTTDSNNYTNQQLRSAIQYRLGVKQALLKYRE